MLLAFFYIRCLGFLCLYWYKTLPVAYTHLSEYNCIITLLPARCSTEGFNDLSIIPQIFSTAYLSV